MPQDALKTLPRALFGNVGVGTGDMNADLTTNDRTLECSLETGEQASYKQYLTKAARITAFKIHVTKALAGTDAATVDLLDSAGNNKGTMSLAISLAINTEQTMTVTPFNVAAGSFYRINATKTTAGGKFKAIVTEVRNGGG